MRVLTQNEMKAFETNLYEEEKSGHTIEKYLRDSRCFMEWAGERPLHKAAVLEYKRLLCKQYAPASVNSMVSSINALFAFLGWHDLKVKTLKIQRRIFADREKELTKAEYARLLDAAKRRKNERVYYLMQTVAATGIRISELSAITVSAVMQGQAVISCKGKIRQIFLPKKLCKLLKTYIKKQKMKSGAVFVSRNGNPLNRSNIWKLLKGLCKEAGVSKAKVFPHNFRHLFARTFYAMQKDIVRLADILGHSSMETTRIYTIESGEVHRRQIQKLGLLRC